MVIEIKPDAEYDGKYTGMTGTITKLLPYKRGIIGVHLYNLYNKASKDGTFWFNQDNLKITEDNEEIKENEFMDKNFNVAGIQFIDGTNMNKVYAYALYDNIGVGNLVAVKTGHHGIAVAKLVNINELPQSAVEYGREVIGAVDTSAYDARIQRKNRLKEIKQEMDKQVKLLQQNAIYEMLAEKDEGLKQLLDEYKSLI